MPSSGKQLSSSTAIKDRARRPKRAPQSTKAIPDLIRTRRARERRTPHDLGFESEQSPGAGEPTTSDNPTSGQKLDSHEAGGSTAHENLQATSETTKRRWDPMQRYRSDASSFPIYRPPSEMPTSRFLKDLNQSVGPVNTLSPTQREAGSKRSPHTASEDRAPKRLRRSDPSQAGNHTTSRFFANGPLPVDQLSIGEVNGSVDDSYDRRSVSSGGKARSAATSVPEFRHVQPGVNKNVKNGRMRRSRQSGLLANSRNSRYESVTAGDGGRRMALLMANGSVRSGSSPESPDVLAVDDSDDPPPAMVVSDLIYPGSRGKRGQSSHQSFSDTPQIKRPKTSAAVETIDDSEDELNGESNQRRSTDFSKVVSRSSRVESRGDISRTRFQTTSSSGISKPSLSRWRIKRAVGGSHWYEHKGNDQGAISLDISNFKEIHPTTADGNKSGQSWLRFDAYKVKQIQHNLSNSPHIILSQPSSASADVELPPKLYLEFAENMALEPLITHQDMTEKCKEMEVHTLKKTMDRKFDEAREHSSRTASDAKSRLQRISENKYTPETVKEAALRRREQPRQRAKLKDQMIPDVEQLNGDIELTTEEVANIAGDDVRVSTRRTRRRSPANSTPPAQSPRVRWTETHPGWEESWSRSLVFPASGKNRTTVDKDDIPRLDDGEYLNDNLLTFYIRHLQVSLEEKRPELLKKVYIFNTFFFEKLRSGRQQINYEGVRTWTTKFDLFSYDYVVVPVHENLHWYLAIICNTPNALNGYEPSNAKDDDDDVQLVSEGSVLSPGVVDVEKSMSEVSLDDPATNSPPVFSMFDDDPSSSPARHRNITRPDAPSRRKGRRSIGAGLQKFDPQQPKIVTLDSLGSPHPATCKCLKDYLIEEAKDKKSVDLAFVPGGMTAKEIPQQTNYFDCGTFVLGYLEEFLKDPDEVVRKLLQKEPLEWELNAAQLRGSLRELIFDIHQEQQIRLDAEREQKRQKKKAERAQDVRSSSTTPGSAAKADIDDGQEKCLV